MPNFACMKRLRIYIGLVCICISSNSVVKAKQETTGVVSEEKKESYGEIVSDTSNIRSLDEIVVVSQAKESATLRNLPLAYNVLTNSEIQSLAVNSLSDLSFYVPSFSFPQYGSRLTSSVYVRGIGSRVNNPAIGVYIDGMPLLSKSAYNSHIYQVDRIEILRGPQGTLYGMNTEGGLLRMFTKNPLSHDGTDIKLELGTHFLRNLEVSKFFHLDNGMAFSVSGFYNGTNGFLRNTTTGKRADVCNEGGGRFRIAKQLNSSLYYDFFTDYQHVNQNGFAYGIYETNSGSVAAPQNNRNNVYRRNIWNSALKIAYAKSNRTFTSTTSYQFLSDRMEMDQDYSRLDCMHLAQKQLKNGLTQEFMLKAKSFDIWKHTTGIFASYLWERTEAPVYFDIDFNKNMESTIQTAMYGAILSTMTDKFKNTPGITDEKAMEMAHSIIERSGGINVDNITLSVPGMFHTPQFNLGVYHESLVDISKRFTLNIGLRYDYSNVRILYETKALFNAQVTVMGKEASTCVSSILCNTKVNGFNQVLPKIGFTWHFGRNASNIYVSVCKGYRAGGYNTQMFSDILQSEIRSVGSSSLGGGTEIKHTEEDYEKINSTISYKPEHSWNYEIGSHLNLFGNKVQADIAAYYIKIRNQQLSVMAGNYNFGRMMVNAGKSHSIGAEISLRGKAFDNRLAWNASYGLTHSVFDNYKEETDNTTNDYAGKRVAFVPRHTFALAADWIFHFTGKSLNAIVVGANTKGQGKTYWDETNSCFQNFYALLGAHVDAKFSHFTVSIWAKNITSAKYATFAFSTAATGQQLWLAQKGEPFNVGINANIHF